MKYSSIKWRIFLPALIAAIILSGTGPVSAGKLTAGLCSDTLCRGKDPIDYQCYNVSTIAYSYYPNDSSWKIYTELRKSTDCNSLWSRATKSSSYSGNWMLSEALECVNNDCKYTQTTPPPNPSTY